MNDITSTNNTNTDMITTNTDWMKNGCEADIMNEDGTCTIRALITTVIRDESYPGGGFCAVHKYGPYCGGQGYVNFDRLAPRGSLVKKQIPELQSWVRPYGW
jgi:hypothetical protein